jgi:hypothetical protein
LYFRHQALISQLSWLEESIVVACSRIVVMF